MALKLIYFNIIVTDRFLFLIFCNYNFFILIIFEVQVDPISLTEAHYSFPPPFPLLL